MYQKFQIENGTIELYISEEGETTRTTQVVKTVTIGDDVTTTNDYIEILVEDMNIAFPPPNKTKLNQILSQINITI